MVYQELFVGIDVSKLRHDVAIVNEHRKLVQPPFTIKENYADYQGLLRCFEHLKNKYQTENFFIGMESTGDYWKNLYYFLKEQGRCFKLTLINPLQTKSFTTSYLRRAKTDKVSAIDIALFMVERRPAVSLDRLAVFEHIKDIDKQIYTLTKQRTMVLNKLRIELSKVAPEIEQSFPAITGQKILALLLNFPTAEAIREASLEELMAIRYGKCNWPLPIDFIEKMRALVQNSVAHKTGPGTGVVVQCLVKQILQYNKEIQLLKDQLTEIYSKLNCHESILSTIKGISKETAIIMEAYIGDVNRFANAKKIVAYFGMNPTVAQSGKSVKRKSCLEKKGSGIFRHKLFMVVLNMIRFKHGPIYEFYSRLVASGKPKMVAIGAAMRKLLVIIYSMLKKQEPFDPNKN